MTPAVIPIALRDTPQPPISDTFAYTHIDDIRYLQQALEQGMSGNAPMVETYETMIAAYYQLPHALAVSSGAAAVSVALASIDWTPGDEVIVPPTCPLCSVLPILAYGLHPVFCDVLPDNFGLDPLQVEQRISDRTRAIIEIPMWGYPTRVDRLQTLAKQRQLPLILDLAHCHLTRLQEQWLPHFGDIACFSTHTCKFLSTGEGGFIVTHDPQRADRMRAYSRFGNMDGIHIGLNYQLGGLQAAIGVARFGELNRHLTQRLHNRHYLLERIDNPQVRELPIISGGAVNGYALLLQTTCSDGRALVQHQHRHGIPSDIQKYDNQPLYVYPLLAAYRHDCPNAAALLRSLTTIPLHPNLQPQQLDTIAEIINNYPGTLHHAQ